MKHSEAYLKYPNLSWVYDKLALYQKLGYNCGPAGTFPEYEGEYFAKPIMNLYGEGVGACKVYYDGTQFLYKDVPVSLPPGYLWMDYYDGDVVSVDVSLDMYSQLEVVNAFALDKNGTWRRHKDTVEMHDKFKPALVAMLHQVSIINLLHVDDILVDVHLQPSELTQRFRGGIKGLTPLYGDVSADTPFISGYECAGGFLNPVRRGFKVEY